MKRLVWVLGLLWVGVLFAEPAVTWKQSECLDEPLDAQDKIEVVVEDCVLYIRHLKVVINCCLEYQPELTIEGNEIVVREKDVGPPCDCICPFDLEIQITGLAPGSYDITMFAFLHPDPLSFKAIIPEECGEFVIMAPEVWSQFGLLGVEVPVFATNPKPLQGFSFGTVFPLAHCTMAGISIKDTVTERVGAEFVKVEINNGPGESVRRDMGWAFIAVIVDVEPPFTGKVIPAGKEQHIATFVYDIPMPTGSVPRSIYVPFEEVGKPPVPVVFTVAGQDVYPRKDNGIIQLSYPAEFIRGDANYNGRVTISDPVYLLNYLFVQGPEPPCGDAADANDDGALDLSDAIAMLKYLFAGGEIPPPSPPGPPGHDPTMDHLDCQPE